MTRLGLDRLDSPAGPIVTEKQLNYWVAVMKDQSMLKNPVNVAQLLAK